MQNRFEVKKRKILEILGTPDKDYVDLSPKGSVDEPIRPLIGEINRLTGLVTTSSCSGRISVFCEGQKKESDDVEAERTVAVVRAGPGGKGRGSWLYTSHSPIEVPLNASDSDWMSLFGLQRSSHLGSESIVTDSSYIHLKFEPMILHILTASLENSQHVLTAALSSGFRESGAVSLSASNADELNPMVAVRSTGYSFDSIIGYRNKHGENIALVDEAYLRVLVSIANERFNVNVERTGRFRAALLEQYAPISTKPLTKKSDWEDPEARRQRKREEGLARRQQLQVQTPSGTVTTLADPAEDIDVNGYSDWLS